MEASEQGPQDGAVYDENSQQDVVQEGLAVPEEEAQQEEQQQRRNTRKAKNNGDRGGFVHGISVGLGMGCIATFVIIWIAIFFTPRLPTTLTYEYLLSIFIYPLIYLLAVGLVALTAGIVREYYSYRREF
jgi:hypothetical protein